MANTRHYSDRVNDEAVRTHFDVIIEARNRLGGRMTFAWLRYCIYKALDHKHRPDNEIEATRN